MRNAIRHPLHTMYHVSGKQAALRTNLKTLIKRMLNHCTKEQDNETPRPTNTPGPAYPPKAGVGAEMTPNVTPHRSPGLKRTRISRHLSPFRGCWTRRWWDSSGRCCKRGSWVERGVGHGWGLEETWRKRLQIQRGHRPFGIPCASLGELTRRFARHLPM